MPWDCIGEQEKEGAFSGRLDWNKFLSTIDMLSAVPEVPKDAPASTKLKFGGLVPKLKKMSKNDVFLQFFNFYAI